MNLERLTIDQLLKLKEDIESQLKHINDLNKIEIKESLKRDKLSDLINTKFWIFCISFNGSVINNMDYVRMSFHKKADDENNWIGFATEHESKPMGVSSSVEAECMNNHYFLSEFYSNMYFFTLKPETWRADLKSEVQRLSKAKKLIAYRDIMIFKSKVSELIKSNKVSYLENK
jgi:hypothetical protein